MDTAGGGANAQASQRLERGPRDRRDDRCGGQDSHDALVEQAVEPVDQALGELVAETAAAGLRHDVTSAKRQRFDRRRAAFLALARQDRDLHVGLRLQYRRERGKAALPRQFDVEQNQIDGMIGQIAQGQFRAVALVNHAIGWLVVQYPLDHRADHHRIIDDQGAHGTLLSPYMGHDRHVDGHHEALCTKTKR